MTDRIRARLRSDRHPGRRLAICGLACLGLLLLLTVSFVFKAAPQPGAQPLSLNGLRAAYGRVEPGQTQARELAGLGFDVAQPGVQRLSYLGLMEAFAPQNSAAFDGLDAAAQECLGTPDGCRAYVFRLARAPGNAEQVAFSLVNPAEAGVPSAEILFLIRDGRVAYKAISGV
jgi:hypothetical protein